MNEIKPSYRHDNPLRELEILRAENEALRQQLAAMTKERDEIAAQARMLDRMVDEKDDQLAAALAANKDAERWKYARRKICFTGNGDGTCMMHGINLPAAIPGWPDPGKVEEFCDAAIDAAVEKENDQ